VELRAVPPALFVVERSGRLPTEVTDSHWVGIGALAVSLGFLVSFLELKRRHRGLRRRGVAAVGRVLKVVREWGEGGRGWVSEIGFTDALGEEHRFDARGRFEGEVGVSYDPKRPARARVTTRSPYSGPAGWQLLLVYSGLSVVVLAWLALLVTGVLLVTGQLELSSEVLHGG
jgi:hypothetical protein